MGYTALNGNVNSSFSFFGFGILIELPSDVTTMSLACSCERSGRIRATIRTLLVEEAAIVGEAGCDGLL